MADDPIIRSSMNAVVTMCELVMTGDDDLFPGKNRESIAKIEIGSIQMVV